MSNTTPNLLCTPFQFGYFGYFGDTTRVMAVPQLFYGSVRVLRVRCFSYTSYLKCNFDVRLTSLGRLFLQPHVHSGFRGKNMSPLFVFLYPCANILFLIFYRFTANIQSFNDLRIRLQTPDRVDRIGEVAAFMGNKDFYCFS